ncbi:MAG TPA: hypothetical protein G4N96_00990 [Chloroflexi bacterium]|nr:hypothetical protein [Chloroflexota bacterium]
MKNLQRWTPALHKRWLHALAGIMWSGVGIFLMSLACGWLRPVNRGYAILLALAGVLLAAAIYRFGFSKFSDGNIGRIGDYVKQKVCIFAFQKWSSYPLVAFMIGLGITLRHYSPIPKPLLAVMYIGIGGSLFLASFHYYAAFWKESNFKALEVKSQNVESES